MDSLWPRIAQLPLVVEGHEFEKLAAPTAAPPSVSAATIERVTTHVRLVGGGGTDGLGEDISVNPLGDGSDALHASRPELELTGEWTLESFCDHLADIEQWPEPPEWDVARLWRNWAFESAALDLALRQAARALHEVLDRTPRPVRFVNSLGLGEPPSLDAITSRLDIYPSLRFKVDAHPAWTPDLIAELSATNAVDSVDFKGHYGLEVEDEHALATLYERVIDALPDALLEDPHDLPEIAERVAPHVNRVSYDAPVHSIDDIEALPFPARTVNIKPCRTGGLRPLLDLYAYCDANGLRTYGGGMGELGVGRGQVQLLASLFHPDSPNDVAPSGYNAPTLAAGLPDSPLPASPEATGFRRRD